MALLDAHTHTHDQCTDAPLPPIHRQIVIVKKREDAKDILQTVIIAHHYRPTR